MSKWKLYWVASDGFEDCFVVAKNSRSARKVEKDMNDFDDEDIEVTRIADVPDEYEKIANKKFREWSKKHNCNNDLDINTLIEWPYYADEWLLKKLGVEYRTIDGEKQTLINDTVITPNGTYSIGLKAMKELRELTGGKFVDISNVSYEGMRKTIDYMLGVSISTIHRIEDYITNSFIFVIGNKKYSSYTFNEVRKLWREKFTFGKLINLIEERYEIDEMIHNSFELFLTQRNKIVHGLTKEERFDVDTIWGQKEIIGYLALFLENAWILEDIAESAQIASIAFGFYLMKAETKDKKLLKEIKDFENDPVVNEKLNLFTETFKMKAE